MGQGKDYLIEYADKIFDIDLEGKRIFFKFGANSRMDLECDPFERICLTVQEHINTFSNTTFVYYGWELVECLDQLYISFNQCDFFITLKTSNNFKNNLLDNVCSRSKVELNKDKVWYRIEKHFKNIENFLSDKKIQEFNGTLDDVSQNNRYSCFVKGNLNA
jgi:hypothetical protein